MFPFKPKSVSFTWHEQCAQSCRTALEACDTLGFKEEMCSSTSDPTPERRRCHGQDISPSTGILASLCPPFPKHLGLPVTLQLPDRECGSLGKETGAMISNGLVRRWNNWVTFDDLVVNAQNGRPGSVPVPSSAAAPCVVWGEWHIPAPWAFPGGDGASQLGGEINGYKDLLHFQWKVL